MLPFTHWQLNTGKLVLDALQQHCHIYGYPKKIVLDNGKEFCNKNLEYILQKQRDHFETDGAARMPTAQSLIER